jgi:hypothetical protein
VRSDSSRWSFRFRAIAGRQAEARAAHRAAAPVDPDCQDRCPKELQSGPEDRPWGSNRQSSRAAIRDLAAAQACSDRAGRSQQVMNSSFRNGCPGDQEKGSHWKAPPGELSSFQSDRRTDSYDRPKERRWTEHTARPVRPPQKRMPPACPQCAGPDIENLPLYAEAPVRPGAHQLIRSPARLCRPLLHQMRCRRAYAPAFVTMPATGEWRAGRLKLSSACRPPM